MTEIILQAEGERLGRLATRIAGVLQNKGKASYNPRLSGDLRVIVKNIGKLSIGGNKATQKTYYRHTGYMGHLRERSYEEAFAKNPGFVLRRAVRGMLPRNTLAAKRLKNLIIE